MKGLRKNLYAVAVITLFAIAFAMLVLFLALFSSSTAVDGTTVGSVYIGDKKANSEERKQKLVTGVKDWQNDARYSISFQNYSFVIGRTERINENGDVVTDEQGNVLYDDKGLLEILDFDYAETNRNIKNGSTDNNAVFTMSDDNKAKLFQTLVDNFGSEVTDEIYFLFDALVKDIIKDANEMNTKCDYDLYDYLETTWTDYLVSQVEIEGLSEEKINFLYDIFEGKKIVIAPQKSDDGKLGFSAVEFFSKDEFANVGLTSSDMSIIATGFAAVVQPTSLTVTVKNQGYVSDRYYAYDDMTARVNIKDGTDLRIMNPETHEYVITIEKGESTLSANSLRFKLNGCRFVDKYEVVKVPDPIDPKIIYDRNQKNDLDTTDPNVKIDYEKGCYYLVYQEGIETVLYSYVKTTTYVDGRKPTKTEVYPKQEFIVGQDELRQWKEIID